MSDELENFSKKHLCNAGYNCASILPDGSVNVCFDRKNDNIGSIYTGFKFKDTLQECDIEFCQCPLWLFEKNLYAIAKGKEPENKSIDFQAFFHWHLTYSCNLLCSYCTSVVSPDFYIDREAKAKPPQMIDIKKLTPTFMETDNKYLISFIGGEPFLVPNISELCSLLSKKHIINFNTNLTELPLTFFDKINIDNMGAMHISIHIHSMKRKNLTEKFILKTRLLKEKGFKNYFFTVVADPIVLDNLPEHIEFFAKNDIFFKLIPMYGTSYNTYYEGKIYPKAYTEEQLKLIDTNWYKKYHIKK